MKNYRDLMVWQKAMRLVSEIYRHTKSFPEDEHFSELFEKSREIERMLSSLIRKITTK